MPSAVKTASEKKRDDDVQKSCAVFFWSSTGLELAPPTDHLHEPTPMLGQHTKKKASQTGLHRSQTLCPFCLSSSRVQTAESVCPLQLAP